jgi:hypothetical protein
VSRDTVFAALALLRCRDRVAPLLDAAAEPRRSELAEAIDALEGLDDSRLKQLLADVIRREDAELKDEVMRLLGPGAAGVPRAVWRWAARGMAR